MILVAAKRTSNYKVGRQKGNSLERIIKDFKVSVNWK